MTATFMYTGEITIIECASCHTHFGVTPKFIESRRRDHKMFYCPSGHSNYYPGKSDVEKLRQQLDIERKRVEAERTRAAFWREEHERTTRSLRATKGHLTRIRNRIAAGICPVPGCRRSGFVRIRAHIAAKHPEWLAEHVHDLEEDATR